MAEAHSRADLFHLGAASKADLRAAPRPRRPDFDDGDDHEGMV